MTTKKKIPLSQGKSATVDSEDYGKLKGHHWTALNIGKTTYAVRRKSKAGGLVYMHREVRPAGSKVVDHKDRNGLNDTRKNLRPASQSQNQKGVKHDKSKGTKGKGR